MGNIAELLFCHLFSDTENYIPNNFKFTLLSYGVGLLLTGVVSIENLIWVVNYVILQLR